MQECSLSHVDFFIGLITVGLIIAWNVFDLLVVNRYCASTLMNNMDWKERVASLPPLNPRTMDPNLLIYLKHMENVENDPTSHFQTTTIDPTMFAPMYPNVIVVDQRSVSFLEVPIIIVADMTKQIFCRRTTS